MRCPSKTCGKPLYMDLEFWNSISGKVDANKAAQTRNPLKMVEQQKLGLGDKLTIFTPKSRYGQSPKQLPFSLLTLENTQTI